jgi:hypothetical protein
VFAVVIQARLAGGEGPHYDFLFCGFNRWL